MLQAGIDSSLLLMSNQTITTTTNGTIVLDLNNITASQNSPQAFQLNLDLGDAVLTSNTYTFIAQNANDNAFSQLTVESRAIVSTANGLTGNNVYIVAFSPRSRYVRLRVEVSGAGASVLVRRAWLSPATITAT